jgi:hypothetical protein
MDVFAEFLMRTQRHLTNRRDARPFESVVYCAFFRLISQSFGGV